MNIPIEPNQKFQIGDICKIIHTKKSDFIYPSKEDNEDPIVGLYVIILGSYWQICGNQWVSLTHKDIDSKPLNNLIDYQVIAPWHLNKPKCSKTNNGYYYHGIMSTSQELAWVWVEEHRLEFVRHWNDEEKKIYEKEVELYNLDKDNEK